MITYTGKAVDVFNLKVEDICLLDIAHSLSLQCRYIGHCKFFYSIAEHSIRATSYAEQFGVDPRYVFLHDAAEAYCGDIIRGVKPLVFDKRVESKIRNAIFSHFSMDTNYWEVSYHIIKEIDDRMLATEFRDLMPKGTEKALQSYHPFNQVIAPWEDYKMAEVLFLENAKSLGLD